MQQTGQEYQPTPGQKGVGAKGVGQEGVGQEGGQKGWGNEVRLTF